MRTRKIRHKSKSRKTRRNRKRQTRKRKGGEFGEGDNPNFREKRL